MVLKAILESLRDMGAMFAIVLLCIGAAIVYGICHDQITARVCIEYFSVFHPTYVLPSGMNPNNPTQQGFFWGVFATWWMGMFIGVPLSIAARVGSNKPLSARDLLRPVGVLLAVMAICALVAGIVGYFISPNGTLVGQMLPGMAEELPPDKYAPFLADYFAHNASYFVGGTRRDCGDSLCGLASVSRAITLGETSPPVPLSHGERGCLKSLVAALAKPTYLQI